jgi:hypothetical protein
MKICIAERRYKKCSDDSRLTSLVVATKLLTTLIFSEQSISATTHDTWEDYGGLLEVFFSQKRINVIAYNNIKY